MNISSITPGADVTPGKFVRRTAEMLAACILAVLITANSAAEALNGNESSGILPPNSTAGGHSLQEWFMQYLDHLFTGEPASGMVGEVLLLPAPATWGGKGHLDITVKSGTMIFYVPEAQIGCLWWNGAVSDPALMAGWHKSLTTEHTLDGIPILQDLQRYYIPPTWFEAPHYFPPSKSHKAPVAALWAEGFGFLIAPLPVGVHTLTSYVQDSWSGGVWDQSWTITVVE
jgi:hypothetical protein